MSLRRRCCGSSSAAGPPASGYLHVDVEATDLSAYDAVFRTGEVA
jgi:hypothetical protein